MRTDILAGLSVRITGGLDGNGSGKGPLLVLLHGYGAPGTDLVGLARELDVHKTLRFAFPEAPLAIPLGPGEVGRAWWNIDMLALQQAASGRGYERMTDAIPVGMPEARDQLSEHLALLLERLEVPAGQLVLGGFSQGAMLSCELAFGTDIGLAGLVVMSGSIIHRSEWLARLPLRAGLPALQSHGRSDPILPFALAEQLRGDMVAAGLGVQFMPFPGGHGIGGDVMSGLRSFLSNSLP